MHNEIPLARGLGSSAAATVGGCSPATRCSASRSPIARHAPRSRAEIEGHPDNAAAALLGGFVVSAATAGGVEAIRFDAPRDLRAVLFIPDLRLSTDEMREALPGRRSRWPTRSPTSARSRSASPGWPRGRYDLLALLTVDRLHEPYRAALYPQLPRLVEAARDAGRARGLPVGRRLDDPRLRRLARGDLPDRGRVPGRGRRHGPARVGAGRRAPRNAGATVVSTELGGHALLTARRRRGPPSRPRRSASANSANLRSKKLCGAPG